MRKILRTGKELPPLAVSPGSSSAQLRNGPAFALPPLSERRDICISSAIYLEKCLSSYYFSYYLYHL